MTIQLTPDITSAKTLQEYLTDCQRVLHDATNIFYSETELIDYINKARKKIAAETGCTRELVAGITLVASQSEYTLTDIKPNRKVLGVLDIYLNSNNTRVPLRYFPYSAFSRLGSVMYTSTGLPALWSQLNRTIYINPTPPASSTYTADFDCVVEPSPLENTTDIDSDLIEPYTELVKFYVGYLCKIKDQRRDQAEEFLNDYIMERSSVISSGIIRRLIGA